MFIAHFLIKKPEWYQESATKSIFNIKKLLQNRQFILIWLVFFLNISAGLSLISTASNILKLSAINPTLISICISIMGIFNGIGRLIFSAISDRLKSRSSIYILISLISFIVTIKAFVIPQTISIPIILIIISACYGAGFSCLPSLLSDIFGMDNISKIHGITLTAWAVAGLVGNQISSIVFGIYQSYIPLFVVLTIIYIIQFILTIIINNKSKQILKK